MKFKLAIFSFLLAFAMTSGFLFAQDANSTALKKFVTPDVVGIAYVDLENMDLPGAFELFRKFGFHEGSGFGEPARAELDVMIEDIASMKKAGLSKVTLYCDFPTFRLVALRLSCRLQKAVINKRPSKR